MHYSFSSDYLKLIRCFCLTRCIEEREHTHSFCLSLMTSPRLQYASIPSTNQRNIALIIFFIVCFALLYPFGLIGSNRFYRHKSILNKFIVRILCGAIVPKILDNYYQNISMFFRINSCVVILLVHFGFCFFSLIIIGAYLEKVAIQSIAYFKQKICVNPFVTEHLI